MIKLRCSDYGFDCKFEVAGETQQVVDDFQRHMYDVHGIEYSREALMQFVHRKNPDA